MALTTLERVALFWIKRAVMRSITIFSDEAW